MAVDAGSGSDVAGRANGALARLAELQPDLRAAALLDRDGRVVASTGVSGEFEGPARSLLATAGAGPAGETGEVHVATPRGEVLALCHGIWTLIAVTDRFVLASLFLFDMRSVLREIEAAEAI